MKTSNGCAQNWSFWVILEMGIGDFGCGVDNAILDCKWVLFKIEALGDFARDLALVL